MTTSATIRIDSPIVKVKAHAARATPAKGSTISSAKPRGPPRGALPRWDAFVRLTSWPRSRSKYSRRNRGLPMRVILRLVRGGREACSSPGEGTARGSAGDARNLPAYKERLKGDQDQGGDAV